LRNDASVAAPLRAFDAAPAAPFAPPPFAPPPLVAPAPPCAAAAPEPALAGSAAVLAVPIGGDIAEIQRKYSGDIAGI
jgi:hypothetical protein